MLLIHKDESLILQMLVIILATDIFYNAMVFIWNSISVKINLGTFFSKIVVSCTAQLGVGFCHGQK